ncbi:transposase [Methylocystis heyeri]|uniref:Transposase n=1 Tax=Methylocystis heyeri TaxID=391905 RepID=A0A6B8KFU3_9HYPH|nr:transposase [Methylocystis heyeri]QGM45093.1 transposase [Methylocystis heyeri]QGM45572.1 transposase [Methylocystis heyeri]QGM46086.1 transposase [Methylocystis heyeri]QGM46472.1 transposase [Methylocystis heyeri]QGM46620.1 transposase [Methylocystis heyeri]
MSAPMPGDRSFQLIEAVVDRLDGAPVSRRRRWSDEFKARAVAATLDPDVNISAAAREMGISPSQLFGWRRQAMREGAVTASPTACANPPDVEGRSAPTVEISVGATVIRVSADIGEADLRRVIRAVRSA